MPFRAATFASVTRVVMTVAAFAIGAATAGAQGVVNPVAYMSASGAVAVGFAPHDQGRLPAAESNLALALPRGFVVPEGAMPLVERMWRASPAFRRQCARLAEASSVVVLSFDFSAQQTASNAETVITHGAPLRAHVRLRAADGRTVEYLAHELEHVLEQIDEVDLERAVAGGVHGAHLTRESSAFETVRAIAIGRLVAREVAEYRR
jgi:hypothetical protein